ncbi:LamG domain-containing protein, partial [bacterium]|nr:LamG domain-containing protein [bacterium]
ADAVRNNYIFASQQNTNASRRPLLAVLPAGTPQIVDPFENGNIATGGLNGGFQLITNSAGGSGSVTEAGSHATLSATGGGNDNSGIVSLNTFNPDEGFTAVWSVTRTQTPAANGLNLLLMAEPGFMNTTGQPNLAFRFEGDGDFSLRTRISNTDVVLASDAFNIGSFNDGFTVVGTFNPAGWEYTIVGLLGMSSPTASGAWTLSRNFDTLFDATTHMAAFIQTGSSGDCTMNIDLMAAYTTPEPGTLALLALGGLGLLRRRRRRGRSKGASVAVLLALCLLAAPAVEAGVYSDWVVDHDPVAYWRLNETAFGAPDDALDASGNGHHGDYTNTGAIALAQPGPRPSDGFIGLEVGNNAASFAGAGGGRVDLDHGFLPTGASQRTIMGWFNGGNTNQQYFSYGQNSTPNRVSVTASNSRVAVAVSGHNYGITGLGLLSGWHHLAIVKPAGATSSGSWQFYIDGVDRTAEATTLAGSAQTINTIDGVADPRWIGQNQGGLADEVAVFDRALTSDTIQQVYNAAAQANTRQVLTTPTLQTVDRNDLAPAAASWAGSGPFYIRERGDQASPNMEVRAFFQFDLTDLGTWPIHGALLKLHEFNKLNSANSKDMGLAVVDAPWTPGSNDPLWNQAIVSGSEISIGTNGPASAGPAVSIDFYIDVTDILLAWQADPLSNHGFRLRFLNDNFVGAAFDLTGPDGVQLIVLQNVPEPGTLTLLALGGLGLLRRRRRRAAGRARRQWK